MKIIRVIASIMLIMGLVFPVVYNKIILPPLNEQQSNFQSLVNGMELKFETGIKFNKMIISKSVFEFLYDYDNKKYTKLDIKNLFNYYKYLYNNISVIRIFFVEIGYLKIFLIKLLRT